MDLSESSKFASGADLVAPIIGLPGLPDNITSFSMKAAAGEHVEITCSFMVKQHQINQLAAAWAPAFRKFKLIEIDEVGAGAGD